MCNVNRCNVHELNVLNSAKREQQTVQPNNNVLFTENRVCRGCRIRHDEGSGIVSLKPGLYRVTFNANLSATAIGAVSVAIKLNGEAISGGIMAEQISATGNLANVAADVIVRIPCDTSATITVGNQLTTPVLVENANITVERIGAACV